MMKLYKKYEEIINYLIVGVLTTFVSLLVKYILLFTFLDATIPLELQISVIISWIAAVTFAYIANRKVVFKSENKEILKEIFQFLESRILTLILEMLIIWFFITFLKMNSKIWVIIWTIFAQGVVIFTNYVLGKLIFKKNVKN